MLKVLLSAITIVAASASIADAQQVCGPRRDMIDSLKATYGETESWYGHIAGEEAAVALLMTGRNGSWTLLIVRPDVACGVASGGASTPLFGDPA